MRIDELRWINIFLFLSYDLIEVLKKELFLNFVNIQVIRTRIREEFIKYIYEEDKLYSCYDIVANNMCEIAKSEGIIDFNKLSWWGRNIFIQGGSDRISETIWQILAVYVSHNKTMFTKENESVVNRLETVGIQYRRVSESVLSQLSQLQNAFRTEYNMHMLDVFGYDQDSITTKLMLIVNLNKFIQIWEEVFADLNDNEEMNEIYSFGQRIIPNVMQNMEIVYPGFWRFELSQYLKFISI